MQVEAEKVKLLIKEAGSKNILANFSVDSIVPVYKYGIKNLKTISKEVDQSLPDWINKSSSYLDNLFEIDEPSNKLILRMAYYLGESLIRTYSSLSWSTGNQETAVQNMPIVTGFKYNMEMAPILVAENTCASVVSDKKWGT